MRAAALESVRFPLLGGAGAQAHDGIAWERAFEAPAYASVGGKTGKKPDAERSNAVPVCHFDHIGSMCETIRNFPDK